MTDEEKGRRNSFAQWLLKAWDWTTDDSSILSIGSPFSSTPSLADQIAELLTHIEEPDYPIWVRAEALGITGECAVARELRKALGMPVLGAKPTGWERDINFSPIIALDERVFDLIYSSMGWANRTADLAMKEDNFWLWSPTGNVIRFIKKVKVTSGYSE